MYKVSVNVKKLFISSKWKKTNILGALNFSGQEKHPSAVPFVTVWQFAAIHKRQKASTQTLKSYIGRIRDWR
jgi:hypothetical protein